jgi:hypothetical protein
MTFSAWIIVLTVFLSGAVAGVFVMLVIGIRIGGRAHQLADEPGSHLDAITPAASWALACATAALDEIAAPKENDQCMLLIGVATPCP